MPALQEAPNVAVLRSETSKKPGFNQVTSSTITASDGEIPEVVNVANDNMNEIHTKDNNLGGPKSPNGHPNGEFAPVPSYVIPVNDQLAFTPRKIRAITVGAGFSGLLMAHKFQHKYPEMRNIVEHKIFEARHDIGGTWLVNTYPGVQCDVPSHIYVSNSPPCSL